MKTATAMTTCGCGCSYWQRSVLNEQRETVMNRWYDRKFEHVLLVYMFAWAVALLVTYMLSE